MLYINTYFTRCETVTKNIVEKAFINVTMLYIEVVINANIIIRNNLKSQTFFLLVKKNFIHKRVEVLSV